jgi:hypothetical protein
MVRGTTPPGTCHLATASLWGFLLGQDVNGVCALIEGTSLSLVTIPCLEKRGAITTEARTQVWMGFYPLLAGGALMCLFLCVVKCEIL